MKDQIRVLRQQGKSIRGISRALKVSRQTVRQYMESGAEEGSGTQERSSHWHSHLDWEAICKQRGSGVTAKILHAEHCPDHISYWAFNRVLNSKMPPSYNVAIPMKYTPGRTVQIDYADGIKIRDPATGEIRKTQFFCGVLPFSSKTFGEFTESQKIASFLDSHTRMFQFFGGVPEYVVHDNLKSATTRAHRYDPDLNPTYVDFANHHEFANLPARPRTPRDKGAVEATIGVIQRSFYLEVRDREFRSLAELNEAFAKFLKGFNDEIMKDYGVSRNERFEVEKASLNPNPKNVYELAVWKEAKVHPDCCIQVDKCFYSVPYTYTSQAVRVCVRDTSVTIYSQNMEVIATHVRQKKLGKKSIYDEHYPPEKLALSRFEVNAAKSKASYVGPNLTKFVNEQLSGPRPLKNLRRVQGVLALSKQQGMTHEALEYAASQAMTFRNYRLAFIRDCAHQFIANKRRRSQQVPHRDHETVFLHSLGGTDET